MTKKEELNRLFGAYDIRLGKLYDKFIDRLVHLGYNLNELTEDVLFNFDNFPELTDELNKVFNDYVQEQMLCYKAGITDGVALAYSQNKGLLKGFSVLGDKALTNVRNNAADAFIRNRLKSPRGLSLSQLVWNYSQQSKSEFEVAISDVIADGLKSGTSAEELGRKVREYLNHPDMMYRRYHEKVIVNGQKKDVVTWRRRVIDENGKVRFVKAPLEQVGMGHYRSSRKNAVRLMRTEINSSYHFANYEFWQGEPYIIGIRISLSPQHPITDICDDLAGDYPKDFKWSGWHPQCYSEDTKVLTQRGWRYLYDVLDNDKIMSLNPQTKEIEWTNIVDRQEYIRKGDMIRFYNRSLDCLVTPEHRMVYLSKSHGEIEYCEAKDFKQSKGAFYRGCKYFADDTSTVFDAGKISIDFDKFCAFMGYWLSDGSVANDNRVIISQRDGEKSKPIIEDLLKSIGFNVFSFYDGLYFYNKKLVSYLKQFGKCTDKYIPDEIKNSSPRQITIFLNAFILCDGYIKKPKTFIGNRGTIFVPKHEEKSFYTTSERMAGDLCELLLKIGHRPSIKDIQPTTSIKKDGTVIKSNHVCYKISDCKAATATVFNKETQYYSGKVYDLTLEKNHIMYMQRNGRCFWGSNCLCTSDPITIKGKEKEEFYRRLSEGEDMSGYVSPNRVRDVPKRYRAYTREHHDEIFRAAKRGKLAWHYLDNTKYWTNQFTPAELKQMGISQPKAATVTDDTKINTAAIKIEAITVPTSEVLKDSSKLTYIERSERLLYNLTLLLGKDNAKVQYLSQIAKLGDDDYRFKIVRKKYNELLTSDGQFRLDAVARLNELRKADLSSIPDIWRGRFNTLIKEINEYDYSNGYNGIVNKIEHAYNIHKLSINQRVRSIGFDRISDKTPYQIFEEFERKIAGFSKSVPKKEFFDKFDEFVPLYLQKAKGAYYHPSFNHVVMSVYDDYIGRMAKAVWYRDGLFYHEYGHAYDWLKKLTSSKKFESIFQDFSDKANKDKGAALERSVNELMLRERAKLRKDPEYTSYRDEGLKAFRAKDYEKADALQQQADDRFDALIYNMQEQVGAFTDCLQAVLKGHRSISPRGHAVSYFSSKEHQLAEFYAHASENFWKENPYFKELAPELYEAMREFVKGH